MTHPLRTVAARPSDPVLDVLDGGVCVLDDGWRITYWNPAAAQLFCITREAALGMPLWDRLPRLRDADIHRQLHAVREDGTPRRFVERFAGVEGPEWVAVYAAPLGDEMVVHFRDATSEMRRTEQYIALLESIRDGFVAVDAGWRIVHLNTTAEQLLRFSREQALGVSLWTLLPRTPPEMGECLRATMDDGIQRHLRDVRPEGRVFRGRVFDLWTYPLAGGGLSILFEDVSERARHEGELARLACEAREANEAKGRFFAAISHELRTPLHAIVGYTHLLRSGTYGSIPPPALRAADRASICAEHLARLVDDVLIMTTAEIGQLPVNPGLVPLPAFVAELSTLYRNQAEAKGLRFEVDVPPDLPEVETDSQRLRQLLCALLTNAVKFTSRGAVRVSARLADQPDGPGVELYVADTGPGIAPEDRERIFGPFEQVGDPARSRSMERGSGLGLAVARRVAELLHGSLFLTSTTPEGSEFCIRLPLAYPAP